MNDIRGKQPKRFLKMFKKKGADKSINDFCTFPNSFTVGRIR